MTARNIFIACPMTKYILEGGGMNPDFEVFIRSVYACCRRYSDDVFFAFERERYGHATMADTVCTPLDHRAMQRADVIVAIPEDSMGVAVELGWASAFNKEILLILEEGFRYSPLITALHTIASVRQMTIAARCSKADAVASVIRFLEDALG